MLIHPSRKTVEIPISKLEEIEQALNSIQETALSQSVNQDDARSIVNDINCVRDWLCMPRDAQRHDKWAP